MVQVVSYHAGFNDYPLLLCIYFPDLIEMNGNIHNDSVPYNLAGKRSPSCSWNERDSKLCCKTDK
jgi:hypothetical protein